MLRICCEKEKRCERVSFTEMSTLVILCSCHIVDVIRPRVPTVPSAITASTLPRFYTEIKRRPPGPVIYNSVLVRLWYNVRIDVT
jgi:hypothetical protein